MNSFKLGLSAIFILILAIVGNVYAQTDDSTGASQLDALRTALAADHYLDAYYDTASLAGITPSGSFPNTGWDLRSDSG